MAISDIPGEIEQTKRRQAGGLPAGIGLTPEQQKTQADAEWRRGAQQRQAEFKQDVGNAIGGIGDAMGQVVRTATTTAGAGLNALRNITFDSSLPDYRSPSQKALDEERSRQYTPQQQAGGIAAFDMAQRAVGAAQQPFSGTVAGRMLARQPMSTPVKPGAPGATSKTAPDDQPPAASSIQSAPEVTAQPGGIGQWSRTGIGLGRAGGEIVGRMGADGVPEFSNATGPVASSGPQRSVGRVGDGIGGGLSVGADGDAVLAMQRFDRANDEREKSVAISKRGGIGEAGGLSIVGSGSDAMDLARQRRLGISPQAATAFRDQQLAEAGLGLRQREQDRADRELDQQGIDAGLDRALRERELAGTEQRNALAARRTQQEIEAGDMTLVQQRRVEELSARIADPATDAAERESLLRTYSQLTGKKLDSGTIKLKRVGVDAATGAKTEEEYLADARTGRPLVDQGARSGAGPAAPRPVGTRSTVGDRTAVWDGSKWVEERT